MTAATILAFTYGIFFIVTVEAVAVATFVILARRHERQMEREPEAPTTPTGIPVRLCECGYTHSATRDHCTRCGRPTAFLSAGRCVRGCPR